MRLLHLKSLKRFLKKSYEAPKTLWLFEVSRTQIATGGRVRDDEGAVAVRDDEAVLSVLNDSLKNRPGPFRCPNQLMQP
ncbi:MAG: hypothetical protein ACPG7U_01230 [Holosporaceae bacterium]